MHYFYKTLASIVSIGLIYFVFQAYFIVEINTITSTYTDGLGRKLTKPPVFMSIFVFEEYWRGFTWWLIDKIIFFGGIYLAFILFEKSSEEN